MSFPTHVKIVEVSPRDGLQNEAKIVPTEIKVEFINLLSKTGLKAIEVTSFVSPKWIAALADNEAVFQQVEKNPEVHYPVLVPNLKGFLKAMAAGVQEIAVFTTPSEEFSQHNTHCSVAESMERISEILVAAKEKRIPVRAYISCVLGCPYEGEMDPRKVTHQAEQLMQMGCEEISLGDTIGVGTTRKTEILLRDVMTKVVREKIAVHFHDTYGQALANIYVALQNGIQIIDSSVGGLGGCPYAVGASGNVATEDVIYLLNGMGIKTGVDLAQLIKASRYISQYLGRESRSKVNQAWA